MSAPSPRSPAPVSAGSSAPAGVPVGAGATAGRGRIQSWGRDLGMGVRFAFTGGRESWVRTLLTAVGVGLGVALLLVTTAFPNAWNQRQERESTRLDLTYSTDVRPKADDTLLLGVAETDYRNKSIRGRLLQPEGPKAPLPPGLAAFPKPGDMVVSPALEKLLASDDGALLRQRLPYRITGTIADRGLLGPSELAYYAGSRDLHLGGNQWQVERIDAFGHQDHGKEKLDPVLMLLVLMVFIVLLMPVAIFIATAVRFGGERRDRRLAALRLVGADGRMTRRIAAGEALAGAAVGLVFGAVFFVVLRQLAGRITLFDTSVFPSDLNPSPGLAVLVALAVPAAAIAVTLIALRSVVIEPLGVVRTARPSSRRLWWRLLLPLGGLALLYPMIGQGKDNGAFNEWMVIGGTVLLLVGVTALLPWVVEAVVSRLGGGSVSWQLAVRRLQLSSGTATRMVNGIAVAVAGAIALQMLFAGVQGDYTLQTKNDLKRAQMTVTLPDTVPAAATGRALRATEGVRHITQTGEGSMGPKAKNPGSYLNLSVGDCSALRELAHVTTCHDGDVFVITGAPYDTGTKGAKPGTTLYVDPTDGDTKGKEVPFRLPADLKTVASREDPTGVEHGGVLATPSALPHGAASTITNKVFVRFDPSDRDAPERVRNVAAKADPLTDVFVLAATQQSGRFASVRTGLFVGATCVLFLIGASLLVSQLEQLRERRKLLSVLVAFGTRRRTLSLSVLWQTAVPIVLGLVLACVVGLALGAVLLKMVDATVAVDWGSVAAMTGIGAAVVFGVTVVSLPPLLRMMRPDGLRTE